VPLSYERIGLDRFAVHVVDDVALVFLPRENRLLAVQLPMDASV
jgi:hypothetical protein